jgi:hypothetical protein
MPLAARGAIPLQEKRNIRLRRRAVYNVLVKTCTFRPVESLKNEGNAAKATKYVREREEKQQPKHNILPST